MGEKYIKEQERVAGQSLPTLGVSGKKELGGRRGGRHLIHITGIKRGDGLTNQVFKTTQLRGTRKEDVSNLTLVPRCEKGVRVRAMKPIYISQKKKQRKKW